MRVLVTGAHGLLGRAIAAVFGDCELRAAGHEDLDISDASAVDATVDSFKPDVIVNCAAFNDVDTAESDAAAALRVNALGVLALARAAKRASAAFVHYSTDFVFDGETSRPYVEEDSPNPRSVYGSSKLLGDWLAAEAGRAYVLRVESLFGGPGALTNARRGSLGTIVQRILDDAEVPVFVDRTVSPSYTPDVARATRALVESGVPPGLYHCVNSGAATWDAIAREAGRLLGRRPRTRELRLATVTLKAARPRYCALSNRRLAACGIPMASWEDALARFVSEIRATS